MRIHAIGLKLLAASMCITTTTLPGFSQKLYQKMSGSTATSVSAELVAGKLSPAESKPGDQVTLKLKDDLKSNGEIVLKKGTTITGIVRKASRVEAKDAASNEPQSLLEIEWIIPGSQLRSSHQLMLAVQSVIQLNTEYAVRQEAESEPSAGITMASSGVRQPGAGPLGGTLTATTGVVGGVPSGVAIAGSGALSTVAKPGSTTSAGAVSRTNTALMSMPNVVAADARTTRSLQSNLGLSNGNQLFQTGHGQILTAGGTKHSVELFSHLNNDTVMTSKSKSFEISSGARMQLLVGVQKN